MTSNDEKPRSVKISETHWSSLFVLCFGIAVLLFLAAIEHQNWFSIKPATGTAAAMSNAREIGKRS